MIDPSADRPVYLQVADDVRAQILDGQLAAGTALPAEARMAYDYGVGPRTVRKALDELERDGLIQRQAGRAAVVRAQVGERQVVRLARGSQLEVRRPTPAEVVELDLAGGEVVVVVDLYGRVIRYGSDRVRFTTA